MQSQCKRAMYGISLTAGELLEDKLNSLSSSLSVLCRFLMLSLDDRNPS